MRFRSSEMNKNRPTLSTKQKKSIQIILSSRSILDGCERAGVGKSTFYLWMQDNEFKTEFESQRNMIIDEGLHRLKISADKAVNVLCNLLDSGSEGTKFRTATAILEHIGKFIELEKIEDRLSKIERRISNDEH